MVGNGSLTAVPAARPSATAPADTSVGAATAARPGPLTASRDAPLGGQAVLEGVMMRGISTWAVAVRKPVGEPAALADSPAPGLGDSAALGEPALGEISIYRHRLDHSSMRSGWRR